MQMKKEFVLAWSLCQFPLAIFPEAHANERLHQWKQNVQKNVLNVCDKLTQD